MEQINNNDNPGEDVQAQPTPPTSTENGEKPKGAMPQTKKQPDKRLLIAGAVVLVAMLAAVGYFVLTGTKNKPAANVQTTTILTPAQQKSQTVDSAVKTITDSVTSEVTTTNTNDTNAAKDASTAAGNVGSSVNENNLQ